MRNSKRRLFADLELLENNNFIDLCRNSNKRHFTRKRKMPLKNFFEKI